MRDRRAGLSRVASNATPHHTCYSWWMLHIGRWGPARGYYLLLAATREHQSLVLRCRRLARLLRGHVELTHQHISSLSSFLIVCHCYSHTPPPSRRMVRRGSVPIGLLLALLSAALVYGEFAVEQVVKAPGCCAILFKTCHKRSLFD